jgi:hypothetical protein
MPEGNSIMYLPFRHDANVKEVSGPATQAFVVGAESHGGVCLEGSSEP